MTKSTITRAQAIEIAIAAIGDTNPAAVEVLNKLHKQFTAPRSKSNAPSKAAIENANLAAATLAAMPDDAPVTGEWIGENVDGYPVGSRGFVSPQKITAVMKILVDTNKVSKAKVGKVMTYTKL